MRAWTDRVAALLSIAVALVGVWWWTSPASYPFGAGDRVTVSLSHLFEHDVAGIMMVAAGAVGLAAILLRDLRLALVELLFFGVVMSDAGIISLFGYVLGLGMPLGLAGFVAVACARRQRSGFVVLGVVAVLAAAALATGLLSAESVSTYAGSLATSFGSYGGRIAWTLANAAAFLIWLAVALRALGGRSAGWAAEAAWTTPEAAARWGRVATIGAALCPLPYGLYRLTWLTPWPVRDFGDATLTMAMRLQGSIIAVSALAGCVLTLGLIGRWGEIFPRWIPVLGGRPVPVGLPVAAGGFMAGMFFLSGTGMTVNAVERGMPAMLLLFPYPLWAPLLGAAVLAYWLRRRAPRPIAVG
ncbi:hypothetical protein OIE66_16155 [Nonomuraea sp. NBC_01738]|uniref:hypothetical protein n=1 Tax=Nonomuraea sp. NBC_01738 TaxID=2976003 RepID=UPI002E11AB23|nr:hypothetical protein OIE66_16155 [Nonomuraea sp. NBC_01738]